MQIKSFDRQILKALRTSMDAALKQVSAEYGVEIKVGNASYTELTAKFSVELASVSQDGTVNTKEVSEFKQFCSLLGLKPEHLGATVTQGREQYRITGLSLGSSKFPILVERVRDGKAFKLPRTAVSSLTGISESTLREATV